MAGYLKARATQLKSYVAFPPTAPDSTRLAFISKIKYLFTGFLIKTMMQSNNIFSSGEMTKVQTKKPA